MQANGQLSLTHDGMQILRDAWHTCPTGQDRWPCGSQSDSRHCNGMSLLALVAWSDAPDTSSVLDADVVTGCMLVEVALPGTDVVGMMSVEVEVVLCDDPESSEGAAEVPSIGS